MTENRYNIPLTANAMKNTEPEQLTEALIRKFVQPMPLSIESADELKSAGELMGILVNNYSYLLSTLSLFRIWTKNAKEAGTKEEANLMMMRRDSIEAVVEILKTQYQYLSRLVTIKSEINREISMLECRKVG